MSNGVVSMMTPEEAYKAGQRSMRLDTWRTVHRTWGTGREFWTREHPIRPMPKRSPAKKRKKP